MFRYEVPRPGTTTLDLTGSPVAVAALAGCQGVEFWAEDDTARRSRRVTYAVFGTGEALPHLAAYRGTTARMPDGHVWHLYELEAA